MMTEKINTNNTTDSTRNFRRQQQMRLLPLDFFARDTVVVAKELVGKILQIGRQQVRIVEVEAYKQDLASHARTRTKRSELMHSTYGHIYVYLIYGMYYCLNITTDTAPGAVLIRAVDCGTPHRCNGPGRLCRELQITLADNGAALGNIQTDKKSISSARFRVYDDGYEPTLVATQRIGIKNDLHLPWRFYDGQSDAVSRRIEKEELGTKKTIKQRWPLKKEERNEKMRITKKREESKRK